MTASITNGTQETDVKPLEQPPQPSVADVIPNYDVDYRISFFTLSAT